MRLSRKDAHLARKARADQKAQERRERYRRSVAQLVNPIRWLRDREYGYVPSIVEQAKDVAVLFARDQERETATLIAAEREQATMALGLGLGSGS